MLLDARSSSWCAAPVVGARGVGQPERVGLGADRACRRARCSTRVLEQRPPDVQLLHVDAVELAQVVVRRLEERPLIAFEVDGDRERQHRQRIEPERVQHLDPDVDVAVLLGPRRARRACSACRCVGRRRRARAGRATRLTAHGQSCARTAAGHSSGSKPWRLEQRHHDALQAEAQARGVRDLAVRRLDVEDLTEVLLVVVERAAPRSGFSSRDHRARAPRTSASAPSGWRRASCRRGRRTDRTATSDFAGQPERRQQVERRARSHMSRHSTTVVGRADADELAHAERLHARRLGRRLVAEHPVQHRRRGGRPRAACR